MGTNVSGYTGLNVDGLVTMQTGVLAGVSLASAVTLTKEQMVNGRIEVTTGHAANAITIPTGYPGKVIILANGDVSLAANIEVDGGSAVTVAAGKTAILQVNGAGTEILRVTADA